MYGLAVEILIEQQKAKARSDGLVSWKNSKEGAATLAGDR